MKDDEHGFPDWDRDRIKRIVVKAIIGDLVPRSGNDDAHRRAVGLLPPPTGSENPFELASRALAAARLAICPTECAYCHLPALHCERHSHECFLGELRRALRALDRGG